MKPVSQPLWLTGKYGRILIPGGILLLGFLLRLIHLRTNQLALDEPFSVFHAQMSLTGIISGLRGLNNPPLNEIILHFWIRLFGISPFSVRFPSLVFGMLNIYLVYLLARKYFGEWVGLLSMVFITFSDYHLYFSHEARVYALFALLTTWSFYLFLKVLGGNSTKWDFIRLYFAYILLVFSHYFGAGVILMQLAFFLLSGTVRRKDLWRYAMVLLAVALSYSWYIPEILRRFSDSAIHGTWLPPVENLGNLHDILFYFANSNRLSYLVIITLIWGSTGWFVFRLRIHKILRWGLCFGIIPLFFLTGYSIFFSIPFIWKLTSLLSFTVLFLFVILGTYGIMYFIRRKENLKELIVVGWFLVPFLLFFGISFFMPIFLDRYLAFVMPAFYITLALLVNSLRGTRFFYPVSLLMVLVMIITCSPNVSNKRDVEGLADEVRQLRQDHTKVLICPEQFKHTFAYHYDQEIFADPANFDSRLQDEGIFFLYHYTDLDSILEENDSVVIYVDARGQFLYPDNGIIEKLTETYGEGEVSQFEDSLYVYGFGY